MGTAGWSIPRALAHRFPAKGSALERYAARFPAAEVNSSFHRPHRRSTWQRWHDSVPETFRFSVKVPSEITHQRRLIDCSGVLDQFTGEAAMLGEKLAAFLVQLPPKLAFHQETAAAFFDELSIRSSAEIVCEPRHVSWLSSEATALFEDRKIARVVADPPISPEAAVPAGWTGFSYWRLHGSPVIYRSSYADRISELARTLRSSAASGTVWCIFDNTASGAGAADGLQLLEDLKTAEEHRSF